jgi:hypothetical protein
VVRWTGMTESSCLTDLATRPDTHGRAVALRVGEASVRPTRRDWSFTLVKPGAPNSPLPER